jgi:5-methyltetrahydrofolate--homocysteine methyltransferase
MIAASDFVTIGENIHTTRVLRARGPQVASDEAGHEAVTFLDETGTTRHLRVPEGEKRSQDYEEGRIKHVKIAVNVAMNGEEPDASEALLYLRALAVQQIQAGSRYLDVNVDEVSLRLADQVEAMTWLVETLGAVASVPLSIDSSHLTIIEAGLETARGQDRAAMLNSASLERLAALDLAAETGGPVIVTAAGESGMPSNADERVENASRMVEEALARNIALDRMYVDPLVFPISVDGEFGLHCLDAIRELRRRFGPEIHITGGMSNVSFGLPSRRILNHAFLLLAIEAGADSGIIDPISTNVSEVLAADRGARPFQLAIDVLTGVDRDCRQYVRAHRAGELETVA